MATPSSPLRVVLIGWGAIGRTTCALTDSKSLKIVGIAVRDLDVVRLGLPEGVQLISHPSELAELTPHVVAEAAGRDSVGPWGRAALGLGADFIVSSVSAFAEPELLVELRSLAFDNQSRICIQPGALGGVDALAAARLMGIDEVEHRMVKPPKAWRGTPAESLCDLDSLAESTEFFTASAAETAMAFPKNANVAMTTALAGIGPDETKISLVADPNAITNRHEIRAHGAFGELDVKISNNPLPANPKSSAMAALNLARAINNRVSAIAI